MNRGHCGDMSKVSVTCTNTSVAADGCDHVESHETEVPFPHLPKFHNSVHKEFLKSNGVDVWLVFSHMW